MSYRIKNSAIIENSLTVGETIKVQGKECIFLPVGLNEDRPEVPVAGMFRYNSTSNVIEYYNGTSWLAANVEDKESVSFSSFNPDPEGDEPSGFKLQQALQTAADNKKTLKIGSGTYNISDQSVLVNVPYNLRVICEGDVVFVDYGREIISADDPEVTVNVPLGMRILGGKTIEWYGGLWQLSDEVDFSFDTTDVYDETNESFRRPVIFFAGAEDVRVYGLGRQGNAGAPITDANRAAIVQYYIDNAPEYDEEEQIEPIYNINLALDTYKDQYLSIAHSFMAFFECKNVVIDNNYVIGDSSDNLMVALLNVKRAEWFRESCVSEESNFDLYAKIMNCDELIFGKQFNIVDDGTGTLFQISGTNITFEDMKVEYDGRFIELTRDYGVINTSSNRITIRNVETSGPTITSSYLNFAEEGETASSIENLIIDGAVLNPTATGVASDVGFNLSLVKNYELRNMSLLNASPMGRTPVYGGVEEVKLDNVKLEWTSSSGSLHESARTFRAVTLVTFNNCVIDCNKNSGGLASLSINGNGTGCVYKFNNCIIKNATFALTNGATVEIYGSTCENFDWTYSPSTKNYISFHGSVVNGETRENFLPETVRLMKTYTTKMSPKLARDFNDLFLRLKATSWYDTIDGLYMLCVPNKDDALINIIDPSIDDLTHQNGLVFSRNIGITDAGDGSLNSNIDPFGPGPRSTTYKFSRNEAYVGVRVLNDVTDTLPIISQASNTSLIIRNGSNELSYMINGTNPETYTNTNSTGFYLLARTSSTNTVLYKDKTEIDTDTEASVALSTGSIQILDEDNTQHIGYVIIGGTDTITDVDELYSALEDFKIAQSNVT